MTYNGLTIADKPALLDAKARGAEWVIAQWGGKAFGYKEKPKREEITDECCYGSYFEWSAQDGDYEIELGSMPYPLVSYQNTEPVNIDLALAQIAEMESKQTTNYCRVGDATVEVGVTTSTPLTWNERINQMTVEETADVAVIMSKRCSDALSKKICPDMTCWQCFIEFLNSPYTEGETK